MVQNAELPIGIFTCGKLHPFNAQNDVFQRLGIQTDLGMGHVGIDDNQIIGIDGVKLILDQKLSLAADNIEKLQMIMGMGYGMPVAAVSGTGNIQQFGGSANGESLFRSRL